MKKLFNSIRSKVNDLTTRAIVAVSNAKAEGYVDTGVKILIAVVIVALLLSLLYGLFNTTIMPTVTKKITELFNFKG
jgi:CHASE3 domain sensor protein